MPQTERDPDVIRTERVTSWVRHKLVGRGASHPSALRDLSHHNVLCDLSHPTSLLMPLAPATPRYSCPALRLLPTEVPSLTHDMAHWQRTWSTQSGIARPCTTETVVGLRPLGIAPAFALAGNPSHSHSWRNSPNLQVLQSCHGGVIIGMVCCSDADVLSILTRDLLAAALVLAREANVDPHLEEDRRAEEQGESVVHGPADTACR